MKLIAPMLHPLRASLTSLRLRLSALTWKHASLLGAAIMVPLTVSAIWTQQHTTESSRITQELPLQLPLADFADDTTEPANPVKPDTASDITERTAEPWQTFTVEEGETLSSVFDKAHLDYKELITVINSSKEARLMSQVAPGQQISFVIDNHHIVKMRTSRNKLDSTILTKTDQGYSVEHQQLLPDVHYAFAKAIIESSLFETGNTAGLGDNVIMQLAGIFGWDIDFALDIRKGDSFAVVYEELFLNGKKIGDGNIVSAEFTNQGKTYAAVRYTDSIGLSNYYTPDGASMRKAFLRTPVDFTRISSGFSLNRRHPILNTIRAHKGIDYAAPTGTPVKAAGEGKVIYAARKGGYGNVVMIDHGQTYQTVYGHLSKYGHGIKNGVHVKQGQIIGYVGMTGLATGPHLHYEFHINGTVRNPVTVKLPNTASISEEEKPRFYAQTQKAMLQLARFTHKLSPGQLALAE